MASTARLVAAKLDVTVRHIAAIASRLPVALGQNAGSSPGAASTRSTAPPSANARKW